MKEIIWIEEIEFIHPHIYQLGQGRGGREREGGRERGREGGREFTINFSLKFTKCLS